MHIKSFMVAAVAALTLAACAAEKEAEVVEAAADVDAALTADDSATAEPTDAATETAADEATAEVK